MKKIIVLIVVVVAILAVIKMIGTGNSVSIKPFASRFDKDEAFSDYDLCLSDDITYKDIIGYTLPETVKNIRAYVSFYGIRGGIWKGFLVAELPDDIFDLLIEKLKLQKEPELFELWPEAFECEESAFKNRYWDSHQTSEGEIYYFEHPEEETRMAVLYGNEKFYFIKETKYVYAGKDERGIDLHKKAKRIEQ